MGGLLRPPYRPTTHHPHRSLLLSLCFIIPAYEPPKPAIGLGGLAALPPTPPLLSTTPLHLRSAYLTPSIPSIDLSRLAPPPLLLHCYFSAAALMDDYFRRVVTSVDTFDPFTAPKPSSGLFRTTKSPPNRSPAPGRHRGHWRCSWLGFETVPRLPTIHHWRLGISPFSSLVGPLVISRAVIAPPRTLGTLGPADYRSPAEHM